MVNEWSKHIPDAHLGSLQLLLHRQMMFSAPSTGSRCCSGLGLSEQLLETEANVPFPHLHALCHWTFRTLDMVQSFFTGYFHEGVQIMNMRTGWIQQSWLQHIWPCFWCNPRNLLNPHAVCSSRKIVCNYLKTWFVIDLIVIGPAVHVCVFAVL